jgi:uncharacterized membrane protein
VPTHSNPGLRVAYTLVLLGLLLPIGLSASGWVGLTFGRGGRGAVMIVGMLLFAALVLWRLIVVVSGRARLELPVTTGALHALRIFGIVCICLGAVVFILDIFGRPLLRMIYPTPSDAGVMFYVVGVYLAALKSVGTFGILCFEFSRLRTFEAERSERAEI